MFVVRFLVLAFLTLVGLAMGQNPADELNEIGHFFVGLLFLVVPALYLLPTFEAWLRKHPNLKAIALLNVFLGWSLIGWVIAAIWAFKKPEPAPTVAPVASAAPAQETKKCPYCAEDILAAAIKCKHCGSALPPA